MTKTEIRCKGCNKLLAKKCGDIIHIKYKQLTAFVEGKVKINCPSCDKENLIE